MFFAKNKYGMMRMYVDYRKLKKLTVKKKYPFPRIYYLFNQVEGEKLFSEIGLRSRYHQIEIKYEEISKTNFRTKYRHYEFVVLLFGLTNAPTTFMSLMHGIFHTYLDRFISIFIDEILIYSRNMKAHREHLRLVLKML